MSSHRKRKRNSAACDLHVVLPTATPTQLAVRQLLDRLHSIGYSTAALTHTIYGRPRIDQDKATAVLPSSLWQGHPVRVLRRLHAVVENMADLAAFSDPTLQSTLLQEYDIVSVSPRNDTCLLQAYESSAFDIITLEPSMALAVARTSLPSSSSTTSAKMMTLEIPYAQAILQKTVRKSWVALGQSLSTTLSLNRKNVRVVFASGDRTYQERDVGGLALRSPGDLVNLAQAVMGFPNTVATNVCVGVEESAEKRRFGEFSKIQAVYRSSELEKQVEKKELTSNADGPVVTKSKVEKEDSKVSQTEEDQSSSHQEVEDGFIAL